MKEHSSACILHIKMFMLAIVVSASVVGLTGVLICPAVAHATIVPTCLGVQARIMPSKDSLPFTEVLSITVTNG